MHPNIQQPKFGKCPICGMDLIPVASSSSNDAGPREIALSSHARKLAEIEITPVERKNVTKEVTMLGKISFDETRVSHLTAWISGRIEKLYVNYVGLAVKKGERLARLFSPEILATHQELIQSLQSFKSLDSSSGIPLRESTQNQLNSIRERLRLWGLTSQQISELEKSQHPVDQITLYSPSSGIIIEKKAVQGMYLKTGSRIFTIADLSKVWVKMDAYETDLPWLKVDQLTEFTTEAYPGEIFTGKIAFIDPVLDPKTRTVKIRVNVNNRSGKLKPEMFVHALIRSKSTSKGQAEAPLVIPISAPLITGKRAVVYIAPKNTKGSGESFRYVGREIELGPRVGKYYIVKSGLEAGEMVVVSGNFKIDSAIQIQAKPSMMNPEGAVLATGHHHHDEGIPVPKTESTPVKLTLKIPKNFTQQLDHVYQFYFELHAALSQDKFELSPKTASKLLAALEKVDHKSLKREAHQAWMKSLKALRTSSSKIITANDIEQARTGFDSFSQTIIAVAKTFGSEQHKLLIYNCPMAFDYRGADWLQNKEGTENPYFGSTMFSCGTQKDDLTTIDNAKTDREHQHEQ